MKSMLMLAFLYDDYTILWLPVKSLCMNIHHEFKVNMKKTSFSARSKSFEAGTQIVISFVIHLGGVINLVLISYTSLLMKLNSNLS